MNDKNIDKKIRVVIAEDHNLYGDGLKMLLQSNGKTDFIAEDPNGKELVDLVKIYKPDIALTDLGYQLWVVLRR